MYPLEPTPSEVGSASPPARRYPGVEVDLLPFVATALALPPGDNLHGSAVGTRDDAPTDAWILVDANYAPDASLADGPGAPDVLATALVISYTTWNDSFAAVLPPSSGWAPGAAYTVAVVGDGYGASTAEGFELSFGVGPGPADPPVEPDVIEVISSPRTEEGSWPGGCCAPTTEVTVRFTNLDPDPWSSVMLLGDFARGEDSGTTPFQEQLGLAVGPGEHTLSYTRREEGGRILPDLSVVGVAADGERSAPVPVEIGDAPGCHCASDGTGGWAFAIGVALVARGRRARR